MEHFPKQDASELWALARFNTGDTSPWIWWLLNLYGLKVCVSADGVALVESEEQTKALVRESI